MQTNPKYLALIGSGGGGVMFAFDQMGIQLPATLAVAIGVISFTLVVVGCYFWMKDLKQWFCHTWNVGAPRVRKGMIAILVGFLLILSGIVTGLYGYSQIQQPEAEQDSLIEPKLVFVDVDDVPMNVGASPAEFLILTGIKNNTDTLIKGVEMRLNNVSPQNPKLSMPYNLLQPMTHRILLGQYPDGETQGSINPGDTKHYIVARYQLDEQRKILFGKIGVWKDMVSDEDRVHLNTFDLDLEISSEETKPITRRYTLTISDNGYGFVPQDKLHEQR